MKKIMFLCLFGILLVGFVSAECIKEGETGFIDLSKRPDNLSYNCCQGLYPISTSINTQEGLCITSSGSGAYKCTSTECGNKICETGENICNCFQDCKIASVTVTSPNGGESWQIGGDYDIKWNSTNVDNINIYLVFPDGALCFLKTTTASQGHYLFHFLGGYQCPNIDRVPHSQPNNNYKIAIFGDPQNVSDYSNNYFLIVYASIQPSITVLSPNGGEKWEVGKTYSILWNTTLYDSSGKIDIQLCDTRGVPGSGEGRYLCTEIISALLRNSGSYSWTIPSQFLGGYPFDGSKVYRIEGRIWPEGLTRWAWIDLSDDNFSISSTQGTESSASTHTGPAINCPSGCVCNGDTTSCPSQGQTIKTPIQSETSTSSGTNQISIGKTSSGAVSIKQGNVEATSTQKLNIIEFKVYLETSSGVKEIKIMPETASETAIAKLGELNFTIELKEVGKGDDAKPVYELTGNKQGKFLGIFKIIARVQAQVDAETGNVKIIKPWWSFLASGI